MWLLPAFYAMLLVGALIHEIGHGISGGLNGYVVGGLGIGLGRPLAIARIAGLPIFIGRQGLLTGLTLVDIPTCYLATACQIRFLLGGIAANLIASSIACLASLLVPFARVELLLFAGVNLLIAVASAIPHQPKQIGIPSDGEQIRRLVRGHYPIPLPVQRIQVGLPFIDLVGALRFAPFIAKLHAATAVAFAQLGLASEAENRISLARKLRFDEDANRDAYLRLVEAEIAKETGQYEVALVAASDACKLFEQERNRRGVLTAQLDRVGALLELGRAAEAGSLLTDLEARGDLREVPSACSHVALYWLQASITGEDDGEIDRRLSAYAAVRKHSLSAYYDSRVYSLLAARFLKVRPAFAAESADAAVAAFHAVYVGCPTPESREAYLQKVTGRLAMLAAVFAALERTDNPTDFASRFEAQEGERERARLDDLEKLARRKPKVRRSIIAYAAASLIVLATVAPWWPAISRGPQSEVAPNGVGGVPGVAVLGMCAAALLYTVTPAWIVDRWRPAVGWIALAISLLPWLVWIAIPSVRQ